MTRGRWRAIWQSTSRDVQRGRLNTDPPTPVATGQTEMVCTTWLGRTALESSEKQWFLFFLDRLEARDSQTGGVEFVVAGKDSCEGCPKANNPSHESLRKNLLWGGGVSCQSWLPPTRGRWRAIWQSISRDVRRGRLNTDPPTPVATGQTVMACTTWLSGTALESSEKQWSSSFPATRDRQAGVVE